MRTTNTFLATAAMLLLSVASYAQCTVGASTWIDLNNAGGAPCFDGTSCAITDPNFTTFGVWGGDAYLLDNVQAGADYVFSMCTGFQAGAWVPTVSIVAPSGAIDGFNSGAGTFLDNCSLSWTATESGTYTIIIHRVGDACGVAFLTDNGNPTVSCGANPAQCGPPPVCDIGQLDVSQSPVNLCPGETFALTTDGTESTPGGYGVGFFAEAGATGGPFNGQPDPSFVITGVPSFPYTISNDPSGLLSAGGLPLLGGQWTILTFAYSDPANATGSICSSSYPDTIVVNFLAATDPLCCTADAGTLIADESPVCFENGTASISASVGTAPTVPPGYLVTYGLVDANGVIQAIDPTASFTVTATGDYSIHTLVYDPNTLNLGLFVPGFVTVAQVNAQLIQGGGSVCASLDLVGASFEVIECVVPCDADAGTLTADASPVCLLNGTATISASQGTAPTVPSGYLVTYGLVDANGVVQQIDPTSSFSVTAAGDYTIHTLVYDPNTLNLGLFVPGVVTAAQVNAQLIQGGGSICGSLDLVGAAFEVVACDECVADAGTLSNSAPVLCLTGASVDLTAVPNGDDNVPAGYQTIYVVTQGAGLVIIGTNATPDFTVTAGGTYTIHTLVYNPSTLDLGIVTPGVTTGFDINALLQQGGGIICGSLDVPGSLFLVEAPAAGTLSVPNPQTCLINGTATISASGNGDMEVPAGYDVLYGLADASGTIQEIGTSSVFTVSAIGDYTVHTLVYDPNTLNTGLFVPGLVTVSMVQTAVGAVCASFDATGVAIEVINCAQCDADAGTITAVESSVCFENGTADISAVWNNDGNVPAGYQVAYVLTEGAGLTVVDVNMVSPDFTVTAEGNYTIHTLVIDPLTGTPLLGASTGFEANNLLIQGGGVICGALDVTGAPIAVAICPACEANAGTISTSQSEVCLTNGTATLSATPAGNAVVPAGFQTLYVLTQGTGLVILNTSATPSFVVNALGTYTIHTLVYDPTTLDVSSVVFGTTTGFDVNGLLEQGGGAICGSLDVTGAAFTVIDCTVPCAGVTAGSLVTSSPLVCLFEGSAVLAAVHTVNPTYPIGFDVLYVLTEGAGLTIVATSNFPVFTVTAGGNYTIHTLVYDPLTLNPATATTGLQVNGLLLQGGGSICGALDVTGVAIYVPDLESTIGVLLNDGDSLYLENAQTSIDFQWYFNGNPIPGATGSSYVISESGNYAVQYTGQNGCTQSSATLPFTYSGGNISVGEQSVFRSVVLFPNPNNGQFSLRGELENATDVSIIVMDVTGRQVMPAVVLNGAQNFTQSIDVTAVANGFYFVRVQAAEGEMTIRFAKQ
jgi:hypothetical protein